MPRLGLEISPGFKPCLRVFTEGDTSLCRVSPAAAATRRASSSRYLSVAVAIADGLGISVAELAGKPSHRIRLSGQWWSSWQTSRSGAEKIASQQVEIKQEGDILQVATVTRGLSEDEGGYHWNGELRLWDNEILMGWYAADDGSIRSKGTMYFALHPHGLHMSGRWVGLGYDGRIMSGWASMGQTREESEKTMARLIESEGLPPSDD